MRQPNAQPIKPPPSVWARPPGPTAKRLDVKANDSLLGGGYLTTTRMLAEVAPKSPGEVDTRFSGSCRVADPQRIKVDQMDCGGREILISMKKTGRGQIRRIVREVYLRDDVNCGVPNCRTCDRPIGETSEESDPKYPLSEDSADPVLVLGSDVILSQIDFLSLEECLNNCVIPISALAEVRSADLQIYYRIRALCRNEALPTKTAMAMKLSAPRRFFVFANEFFRGTHVRRRNGETHKSRSRRMLWQVAHWYSRHAATEGQRVVLLTNSKHEKAAAGKSGLDGFTFMTISEYVETLSSKYPNAGEALAAPEADDEGEGADSDVDPDPLTLDNIEPGTKRLRTVDGHPKVVSTNISNVALKASGVKGAHYLPHMKLGDINAGLRLGKLTQGLLRMHPNVCSEGTVRGRNGREYRVSGFQNLNRAVDGDLVAVMGIAADDEVVGGGDRFLSDDVEAEMEKEELEVIKEGHVGPGDDLNGAVESKAEGDHEGKDGPASDETPSYKGKVVGILKRNWKSYAGTLEPLDTFKTAGKSTFTKINRRFVPADRRIPYVVIKTRHSNDLDGKRLLVVIDSWDRYSRFPVGHWVSVLGQVEDKTTENQVILEKYDVVTREFSHSVLRCLPSADYVIPPEELARRADFRDKVCCSIDPEGCKDIDDALGCERLDNGNFLVSVHIADVTHFVLPDSPLDKEAAERCTTVYLVDKRTDMLPGLLTTDLCSLVEHHDRLTFSVVWEMTPEADIVKTSFHKAVIRTRASLTYAAAQAMIEDDNERGDLKNAICGLLHLSRKLRKRRMALGALELASIEIKFKLDSDANPTEMAAYTIRDTNKLVEEFMLLANSSVAGFVLSKLPMLAILRNHPPPKMDKLKSLKGLLDSRGICNFKIATSNELSESLSAAVKPDDKYFNTIVRVLTTRCMNQAIYVCSGDTADSAYRHYGLAANLYTHFTSPIRRYADVLVHRLLAVALELIPLPDQLSKKERIAEQCDKMNMRHHNAQMAGRDSCAFNTYLLLKNRNLSPEESQFDSMVVAVRENGIQVLVMELGIEGVVYLDKMFSLSHDSVARTLHCTKLAGSPAQENHSELGDFTISVFDHVIIRATPDSDRFRYKINFTFVRLTKASEIPITSADSKVVTTHFDSEVPLAQ